MLLAATASLLLTNATIHTEAGKPPVRGEILIEEGRIAAVRTEKAAGREAPKGVRVVDLHGATVYPGWVDAHGHLLHLGREKENVDVRGKSKAEALAMVAARVKKAAKGAWIVGRGWDQNLWEGKAFPTADELSSVSPDNPVVLTRVDGHARWANRLALAKAGLDPTRPAPPDPSGGRIERDAAGRPSGVLVDNAIDLVEWVVPPPTSQDLRRYFLTATTACVKVGLTGVGDASGYGKKEIDVLRALASEGRLPIRVYATVGANKPELEDFLKGPRIEDRHLVVRAVKMYADGALGSRGAALLAPYADDPKNTGLFLTPPDKMNEIAEKCFRAGWQLWTHAIGDRGNRLALEAYEAAFAKAKPADARPRIEHAQVIALEDIFRFARDGVIASIQPTHATSDMPWAEARLGAERVKGAYAWRRLLDAKVRLSGGSDFPIESEDPRLGFYAAVTRQDPDGKPAGGWRPEERLTRDEALRLFTSDNAYAEFAESRRGKIAKGFDADLTILERDVVSLSLPVSEIAGTAVVMAIVGGEIVYSGNRK